MILQLNPTIPIYVVESDRHPSGNGLAFCLIDYSIEHNVLWGVAFDVTGEVWCIENKYIRMQKNVSVGRLIQ